MVSFSRGNIVKDSESCHSVYSIRKEFGESEWSNKMKIHCIEIDKADKTKAVSDMTPLERVSLYFRYANDPNNEDLLEQLINSGEEAIILAENIFKELTADDRAYEMMLARDKYEWRHNTRISEARKEGLVEGEASGRAEREIEMAKAMKADNEPAGKIARYTGLSVEKIEQL